MLFIFLLLFSTNVMADVYIVSNSSTKEVLSLSDQADAVVPSGHEVTIIKGEAKDYLATAMAHEYKLSGKKLVVNVDKLTKREKALKEAEDKSNEIKLVENKAKRKACEDLVASGAVLKHIKCEDF